MAPPPVTASAIFAATSPIDGSALDPVDATSADQLTALLTGARQAQQLWAQKSVYQRAQVVLGAKQALLSRARDIAEGVHREVGKPVEEAVLAEVLPNADLIDYWCDAAEELLEPTPVLLDSISYPGKSGHTLKAARGVVALITPWNYPVAIPLRTIVPALLCGNAVIFKPSEVAPRSGAMVAALFADILPAGLLTLVQGDGALGQQLCDSGVDLVVFAGSVTTGRKVAHQCAEQLIPCSLELGGKDAAIVLADCRLERAANGVVWGAFTNAGQNCAAIERVYVEERIAEKFIQRVVALTEALRPGIDTAMMTTLAQKSIAARQLEQALAAGASLLTGGAPTDSSGDHRFPPTVLRIDDDHQSAIVHDETFGPLLPICVVPNAARAIELTNASRYALTTSIWSRDIQGAQQLAAKLNSGVVTINNHGFTAALPSAPWTGSGLSGYGITNSPQALSLLTRAKFVLVDKNRQRRELWWYPYTPVLRSIAFAMAKARGGAGLFGRLGALATLIRSIPKRLFGG